MTFRTGRRKDDSKYHYPIKEGMSYVPSNMDTYTVESLEDLSKLDCSDIRERILELMRITKYLRDDKELYNSRLRLINDYVTELKKRCPEMYEDMLREGKETVKLKERLSPELAQEYDSFYDVEYDQLNIDEFSNEEIMDAIKNLEWDAKSTSEEVEKLKKKEVLTKEDIIDLDNYEDMLQDTMIELGEVVSRARRRGLKDE